MHALRHLASRASQPGPPSSILPSPFLLIHQNGWKGPNLDPSISPRAQSNSCSELFIAIDTAPTRLQKPALPFPKKTPLFRPSSLRSRSFPLLTPSFLPHPSSLLPPPPPHHIKQSPVDLFMHVVAGEGRAAAADLSAPCMGQGCAALAGALLAMPWVARHFALQAPIVFERVWPDLPLETSRPLPPKSVGRYLAQPWLHRRRGQREDGEASARVGGRGQRLGVRRDHIEN